MSKEKIKSDQQGTIIDVRSREEFKSGNVPGSVNIPLNELHQKTDELKNLNMPLILCCASGMRSGMAQQMLILQGIECHNGGGWRNLLNTTR